MYRQLLLLCRVKPTFEITVCVGKYGRFIFRVFLFIYFVLSFDRWLEASSLILCVFFFPLYITSFKRIVAECRGLSQEPISLLVCFLTIQA